MSSLNITIKGDKALLRSIRGAKEALMTAAASGVVWNQNRIVTEAQNEHEHDTKTGLLNASITAKNVRNAFDVYLDTAIAAYSVPIHEGFPGWNSDPFLFDAFKKETKTNLKSIVTRRVNKALKKLFKV